MPRVGPFRGLTYDVAVAGSLDRLTAPPYDVISDPRRNGFLATSPHNVVHVDLAEGSSDPEAPGNRYERAAKLLESWRSAAVLRLDDDPGYHLYEVAFDLDGRRREIRGVLVSLELEPWGADVLPHEDTMPGAIEDRLRLLRATRTHLSAVYGTVVGPIVPLRRLLDERASSPPAQEVVDEEGVRHRTWPLGGDVSIAEWLAGRRLLIADGHHRYTTALAYRDERRATQGPGPWDRILTLVVDAGSEDVPVFPYHRVQFGGRMPSGGDPAPSLESLLAALDDEARRYGTVRRDVDGLRFALHDLAGHSPTVGALHREVLDALAPEDAVRFTHDVDDAVAAVARGGAVATYLLPATTLQRILSVVEAGERLPRKSTFFWPKPRTGLVMMPIE